MIKFSSHICQSLKSQDRRKSALLRGLHRAVYKYPTQHNLRTADWKLIGSLLRLSGRNFRYLPWGASYVCTPRKPHLIPERSFPRWLNKMAASEPVYLKETELKDEFEKAYHFIVDDLLQEKYENDEIKDGVSWLQQVIEYNVKGGKKTRGLALVVTFSNLYAKTDPECLEKAFILGWCVEMLQAFFLVSDDIMDQSQTRRGKACWYKKVGLSAVNDAIMLEAAIYKILKDHFEGLPCFYRIVEEFRETIWKTTLGQCLDMKSSPEGHPNWDLFTKTRYETIVKHKTTWYTFCLPIHLAILLGESDLSGYKDLEEILIKLGYYFQVQDDYLDCFGDPAVTGKYGSDIEDGKCTWLILEALRVADDETKKMLKSNYGMNFPDSSPVIMAIYQRLNIPQSYKKFEDEIYVEILGMIQRIKADHVKCVPVLLNILEKLHQRNK